MSSLVLTLCYDRWCLNTHISQLAYNDDDDSAIAMLDAVQGNVSVHELRDTYGADLVQVVGSLGTSCGIA